MASASVFFWRSGQYRWSGICSRDRELGSRQLRLDKGYWQPSKDLDPAASYMMAIYSTNQYGHYVNLYRLKSGQWVFASLDVNPTQAPDGAPITD